jgi:hypothetical protein
MTGEPNRELKGGRYVLVRTLGEGSQGETYEAIDNGATPGAPRKRSQDLVGEWERYLRGAKAGAGAPKIADGLVAIKCFRVGKAKAWKDVELAEREANTLRSLHHPRLPKYIEHFEEDGALYLVMEKIEGESLAALRAQRRRWSVAEVTKMLEDAADALRYLRERSPPIVHRDIKPGNVIRRPDGSFAIVDFGSVRDRLKPTGGSTVVGTFGYMAPEQFQGRASPKSDVYGVGATALAMLTGEEPEDLPHEGLGIDVARAVPSSTPAPLVRALTAMLVPDPDRRAGSVDEALELLRAQPAPDRRARKGGARDAKKERKSRKEKHREKREARRQRRSLARGRAVPLLPRLVLQFGLLVAILVVWVIVGLVTPIVLGLLSVLFGGGLRRAAAACMSAARRSQSAMLQASAWLGGARAELPGPPGLAEPHVRVAADAEEDPARLAAPPPIPAPDPWEEEPAESEPERKKRARA